MKNSMRPSQQRLQLRKLRTPFRLFMYAHSEASNDAAPSYGGLLPATTLNPKPNFAALRNCCQKFRRKQPSAGSLYEWQYKIATASSSKSDRSAEHRTLALLTC